MSYGLRQLLAGDGIDRKMGCEILQGTDLSDPETFNIIKDMILDTDLMLALDIVDNVIKFEIPVWGLYQIENNTIDLASQNKDVIFTS